MRTTVRYALGMLVAVAVVGSVPADEASATKSIKALGGRVPNGGVVDLSGSKKVTDRDLMLLLEFKEVGFLSLNDTAIGDDGMATIGKLAKLRVLELGGTRITDKGIKQLANLSDLEQIVLDRTQVGNAGVQSLKALKKLRHLKVAGGSVTDEAMKDVRQMTNLEILGLQKTRVTDAGVKELRGLKNLDVLWLEGTSVSDATLRLLKDKSVFPRLREVTVGNTSCSAGAREELRKARGGNFEISPR
jgi:internalin A